MERQEFLDEVMREINHIKANATTDEISKLDIYTFRSSDRKQCIYGQMTGSCYSERAKELSPKLFKSMLHSFNINDFDHKDLRNIYTALEIYIYNSLHKTNKDIIAYLKGEIDTITLI